MKLDSPFWVSSEKSWTAGVAGSIGYRVFFAACLDEEAQNKLSQK